MKSSKRKTALPILCTLTLFGMMSGIYGANNPDSDKRAFIALSDRSLALGGLINHYSLIIWKYSRSQATINVNTEYARATLEAMPSVANEDGAELLVDPDRWAIQY